MQTTVEQLIERRDKLKQDRVPYEETWSLLQEFVRPTSPSIYGRQDQQQGDQKSQKQFDGTAMLAAEELASGLHTYLVSPSERWFEMVTKHTPIEEAPLPLRINLEQASKKLYHYFNRTDGNFNPSIHELFLDLVAFGTGVIYQEWNRRRSGVVFRAYSLFDCYIDEDGDGVVNTLFRKFTLSGRQMIDLFGGEKVPQEFKTKAALDEQHEIWHAVQPRRRRGNTPASYDKRFSSHYFTDAKAKTILQVGGYDFFPYRVARWSKLAGEKYGRSPGWNCLPDILLLQTMKREGIISAQLTNSPPLSVEEDSMMLPVELRPRQILIREPGTEPPQPIVSGITPVPMDNQMQEIRAHIIRSFYVDFLRQEWKNERQTAYEIADRRDEKLRMLAPILARLETDLLYPILETTLFLLSVNEPALPPEIKEFLNLPDGEIVFSSPAARSQLTGKANDISRFLAEITPLANIDPNVLMELSMSRTLHEMAKLRGIPTTLLATEEEKQQIREQQAQAQQPQQLAEMASAAKDAAQAQQIMTQGI